MSYGTYLRHQSRKCVGLAVEAAPDPAVSELIDLAQDYSEWANLVEVASEEHEQLTEQPRSLDQINLRSQMRP